MNATMTMMARVILRSAKLCHKLTVITEPLLKLCLTTVLVNILLPSVNGLHDECRGLCEDGFFCEQFSAICLQCSIDCLHNDYPPCGDVCSAFATTPPSTTTSVTNSSSFRKPSASPTASAGSSTSLPSSPGSYATPTASALPDRPLSWSLVILCIGATLVFASLGLALMHFCRKKWRASRRSGLGQNEDDGSHHGNLYEMVSVQTEPTAERPHHDDGPFMSPFEEEVIEEPAPASLTAQNDRPHLVMIAIGSSNPVEGVAL